MIDIESAVINLHGFSETEAQDIRRCLTALYSVREGEQPLERDFGINPSFLDQPMPIARNLFALEVLEKTRRYEKRVSVERVDYRFDKEGQMIPVIDLKRGEGV